MLRKKRLLLLYSIAFNSGRLHLISIFARSRVRPRAIAQVSEQPAVQVPPASDAAGCRAGGVICHRLKKPKEPAARASIVPAVPIHAVFTCDLKKLPNGASKIEPRIKPL